MGNYIPNSKDEYEQIVKLTARQIAAFDELQRDKKSTEDVMKIAINFAMNRMSELQNTEEEIWQELINTHNLNIEESVYTYRKIDGAVYLVKVIKG